MLYDPKWEQPKPDIFALDTLIGWLEQQDQVGRYRYSSPEHCLLAQYFIAMIGPDVVVSYCSVFSGEGLWFYNLPCGWDAISKGFHFLPNHTFGGALKRAKRLRAKAAVGSIFARIPQLLGLT